MATRPFQHFETIGWHQHRTRRLVDAVIGAADPLHQSRRSLGRADYDDEIDRRPNRTPRSSEGGADHATQLSRRHRVLDLAALRDIERTVMQRDRKPVLIHTPEIWNSISAWLRVLTNTSVVLLRLIRS